MNQGNYLDIYLNSAASASYNANFGGGDVYHGRYYYKTASIHKLVTEYDSAEVSISIADNKYVNLLKRFSTDTDGADFYTNTYFGRLYYQNELLFEGIIGQYKLNFKDDELIIFMDDFLLALTEKRAFLESIYNKEQAVGIFADLFNRNGSMYEFELNDISTYTDGFDRISADIRGENRASAQIEKIVNERPNVYLRSQGLITNTNVVKVKIGDLINDNEIFIPVDKITNYEVESTVEAILYRVTPVGNTYDNGGTTERLTLEKASSESILPKPYPFTYGSDSYDSITDKAIVNNPVLWIVDGGGSPPPYQDDWNKGKHHTQYFDEIGVEAVTAGSPTSDEIDEACIRLANAGIKFFNETKNEISFLNIELEEKKYAFYEIGQKIRITGFERYLNKALYEESPQGFYIRSMIEFFYNSASSIDSVTGEVSPPNVSFYIKEITIDIDDENIITNFQISEDTVFREKDDTSKTAYKLAKKLNKKDEFFYKRDAFRYGLYDRSISSVSSNLSLDGKNWHVDAIAKIADADFGDLGVNAPTNSTVVAMPKSGEAVDVASSEMIVVKSASINGVPVSLDLVEIEWHTFLPLAGNANFNVRYNINGDWDSTYAIDYECYVRFERTG